MKKIVIGIDQSYANTGISIGADGKLKMVSSLDMEKMKSNNIKRGALTERLDGLLTSVKKKQPEELIVIIERIRLRSQGIVNINYIKSIGALNACIVDICTKHNVKVYSVDTRAWKSQVVGTSKPEPNKYEVPEEKWPTVRWTIRQGFKDSILIPITGRKEKGTFMENGQKYMYNNDAADSAGICMFGFVGNPNNLEEEH